MTTKLIVVRLGFALSALVKEVDTAAGRIFLNHEPEVSKASGEFLLLRPSGPHGVEVTPTATMAAGFKKADTIEKLAELILEAGICVAFKPRGFHAKVAEGLDNVLPTAYNECQFGMAVKLQNGRMVTIISISALEPGTLVEAVRARNSFLMVRAADFLSEEPYKVSTWREFVEGLLAEDRPKVKGRLEPQAPAPVVQHTFGIWAGDPIDFLNRRGQRSRRVMVDGSEEGTYAAAYFNREDDTPDQTIPTGSPVEVWYRGHNNFAVVPYTGKVTRVIVPEVLIEELGIKLDDLNIEGHHGNVKVTRQAVEA